MMCADASLHANQARLQVGEPGFHLATGALLPQHQGSAAILANEVERVLADIDADYGDFAIEFLGHGVLLCLRCPGQLAFLAGLERRSWPDETERVLAEIDPDYGNFAIKFRVHGALLWLRCPGQLASAGRGLEHGRTIPLPDLESLRANGPVF